ncbi:MAG: ATP-binding cassette domain-containing protein, partial [Sphaerochaeta sp.]
MISINHAVKRYGKHEVVSNVSVVIKPGTLTTLIGANGAGKSTLLSLAGRLLDGEGEFLLEGKDIASFKGSELARQLAMLRQSNHLAVRLTVAELVGFGRFPYSRT